MKKFTSKSDMADDRKRGVKEGSKRDEALDRKRGAKEEVVKSKGSPLSIRKAAIARAKRING